jgi:hypothetical protein
MLKLIHGAIVAYTKSNFRMNIKIKYGLIDQHGFSVQTIKCSFFMIQRIVLLKQG